jgi:ribokinase
MVIKADKFPLPGETILGGEFFMFPGGKGANQAVAAARLGGRVTFITRVGNDIFGEQALQHFKKEGIITDYIVTDRLHPSGVALITVDSAGENTIVVAQGSNGALAPDDVTGPTRFAGLNTSHATGDPHSNCTLQQAGPYRGMKVILNAPAMKLPEDL